MKTFFTIFFILISSILLAQKKYDCIVILRHEEGEEIARIRGKLEIVNDSSLTLLVKDKIKVIDWDLIQTVRFRKHNGFMRTAFSTVVGISLAEVIVSTISNNSTNGQHSCGCLIVSPPPKLFLMTIALFFNSFIAVPIYFITRDHNYSIVNFQDFQKLKSLSEKYISK